MRATSIIVAAAAFAFTVNASAIFKREQDVASEECSKSLAAASSSIVTFLEEIDPVKTAEKIAKGEAYGIDHLQLDAAVLKVQENCCNPPSAGIDGYPLLVQIQPLLDALQTQKVFFKSINLGEFGTLLASLTDLEKALVKISTCLVSGAL